MQSLHLSNTKPHSYVPMTFTNNDVATFTFIYQDSHINEGAIGLDESNKADVTQVMQPRSIWFTFGSSDCVVWASTGASLQVNELVGKKIFLYLGIVRGPRWVQHSVHWRTWIFWSTSNPSSCLLWTTTGDPLLVKELAGKKIFLCLRMLREDQGEPYRVHWRTWILWSTSFRIVRMKQLYPFLNGKSRSKFAPLRSIRTRVDSISFSARRID